MRPLGPVPWTRARSTPNSRPNLRTEGEACGRCPSAAVTTGAAIAAGVGVTGAGAEATTGAATAGAVAAGVARAGVGAAAAAASLGSSISTSEPIATLSPILTFNSFTMPA